MGPAGANGRPHSRSDSAQNRAAEGYQEHAPIETKLEDQEVGPSPGPGGQGEDGGHSPMGRKHPSSSAEQCEQHRLGEHLTDQPASRRPQGRTDGHLLLPRCRTRQQYVGHVHAREQQNHPRKADEQGRDQAQNAGFRHAAGSRNGFHYQSILVFGILAGEPCLGHANPALRLGYADAGFNMPSTASSRSVRLVNRFPPWYAPGVAAWSSATMLSGRYNCMSISEGTAPWNPLGAIPMISVGLPLTSADRPTTPGSPPRCDFQKA